MSHINRRTALKRMMNTAAALAAMPRVAGFASPVPPAGDMPTGPEHVAMARIGLAFKEQFFAPALSVAMIRNSRFVFERAFGMADSEQHLQCSPSSQFRIASVSKPITSVAIFTLVEKGRVNLSDKVFGPGSILGDMYGKAPYKPYVTDITVDHLLTHTCGYLRSFGYRDVLTVHKQEKWSRWKKNNCSAHHGSRHRASVSTALYVLHGPQCNFFAVG
jgi:CubicO group peptidase (beta-lactamase class C family)